MPLEKVSLAHSTIFRVTATSMLAARHDEHLVHLARLVQRIRKLQRRRRIDVIVQIAHTQHQLALQPVRLDDIASLFVGLVDRPAQPLLAPPDLVHAIVVTPAVRRARLVKVTVVDERGADALAAGRAAADTDTVQVHPRTGGGCFLDPPDAVGKPGVLQILVADVVKFFGAPVRAHTIQADYDVALVGQAPQPREGREALGGRVAVWPGIVLFKDGVFLACI